MEESVHWRLRIADLAIRWRFKRHAQRALDVDWARERIGRPLWMRRVITMPVERTELSMTSHGLEVLAPVGRASAAPLERVVLYVHGGGYIACSPTTHRPMAARLAHEWRALTVVPDYRLAPEHAYPAARSDVLETWRWMIETLGVNPQSVVFAGDSAGGGLALAAALACAPAGLPLPAALVLFSPWTDLTCSGASLTDNAERCAMFAPEQLRAAAALYAGETSPDDVGVSPLFADLSLLPPLCIHVGRDELLRDDSLRLAERARAVQVPVELRVWPAVPHVWQFLAGFLPEARESLDRAGIFVREHTTCAKLDGARQALANAASAGDARHNETYVPQA